MKISHFLKLSVLLLTTILFTQCATIREGEVGVQRTLGEYSNKTYTKGLKMYNPFVSKVIKISTQTENLEVGLSIPSKEGLNIVSEVSILYNVVPKKAPNLLRTIGTEYESNIILPVFRSSVADVTSRFFAKDMHTGERSVIEKAIRDQMSVYLDDKGINVEAVLLKSIKMPKSLARAIEEKLEAEQQAQRMEFVLEQTRREADQRRIEAQGISDAQKIISQGLDANILQFKSIEAFSELAKSPNTKIIVTDGDLPMMMEPSDGINSKNIKLKN